MAEILFLSLLSTYLRSVIRAINSVLNEWSWETCISSCIYSVNKIDLNQLYIMLCCEEEVVPGGTVDYVLCCEEEAVHCRTLHCVML